MKLAVIGAGVITAPVGRARCGPALAVTSG